MSFGLAYNSAMPQPILFDTNPGIDDTLALLVALASLSPRAPRWTVQ